MCFDIYGKTTDPRIVILYNMLLMNDLNIKNEWVNKWKKNPFRVVMTVMWSINPRLPEPFFVTRLPKGSGYHPLLDFRY